MKIFTQTYDLAKASPHRFWVAPFSEFKIGIKILEKDEISSKDFTLKAGSIEFTPDADKIDNFTLYTIKSNDTGFVDYTIEVEGVAEKLKLMQIVTDSTVFEIDASGGDVPADVATQTWVNSQISDFVEEDALTAYYSKSETSSATEIGTALEGKQPAGNYLTAETEPAFAAMSADIVVDGDLTAYYTKSETEEVAVLKTLPQQLTTVKYIDGTLSTFNYSGKLEIYSQQIPNLSAVEEVVVGTQITKIGNSAFTSTPSNLTKIYVPDTCVADGASQFNKCSKLSSFEIPTATTTIGQDGFRDCSNLSIEIPDTVTTIGARAFWAVPKVVVGTGVSSIGANAFLNSNSVMFKGKTLAEVQAMANYPWGTSAAKISAELTPTQVWTQANFTANLSGVAGIMKISQADYDVLSAGGTADANTLYVIV